MTLDIQKVAHRFPCIDKASHVTKSEMKKLTRKALKQQGLKGKLSAAKTFKKLKAAFRVDALWNPIQFPELGIAFLDGTEKQINWVIKIVTEKLQPLVDQITFKWNVPVEEAQIRISFALPNQAWSTVGTDALKVPSPEPTMNLGWLDDDVQYDAEPYKNTGQVVLHEFGHAMGMVHEHQNPKGEPIVWNKDVIYQTLQQTNGWDKETTDHNMFKKYGDAEKCKAATTQQEKDDYCVGELVNGSEYDVTSIMHYFYPANWILEGPTEIPVNTKFSEKDKEWLKKFYGKPVVEEEENEEEDVETDEEEEETPEVETVNSILQLLEEQGVDDSIIDAIEPHLETLCPPNPVITKKEKKQLQDNFNMIGGLLLVSYIGLYYYITSQF